MLTLPPGCVHSGLCSHISSLVGWHRRSKESLDFLQKDCKSTPYSPAYSAVSYAFCICNLNPCRNVICSCVVVQSILDSREAGARSAAQIIKSDQPTSNETDFMISTEVNLIVVPQLFFVLCQRETRNDPKGPFSSPPCETNPWIWRFSSLFFLKIHSYTPSFATFLSPGHFPGNEALREFRKIHANHAQYLGAGWMEEGPQEVWPWRPDKEDFCLAFLWGGNRPAHATEWLVYCLKSRLCWFLVLEFN